MAETFSQTSRVRGWSVVISIATSGFCIGRSVTMLSSLATAENHKNYATKSRIILKVHKNSKLFLPLQIYAVLQENYNSTKEVSPSPCKSLLLVFYVVSRSARKSVYKWPALRTNLSGHTNFLMYRTGLTLVFHTSTAAHKSTSYGLTTCFIFIFLYLYVFIFYIFYIYILRHTSLRQHIFLYIDKYYICDYKKGGVFLLQNAWGLFIIVSVIGLMMAPWSWNR